MYLGNSLLYYLNIKMFKISFLLLLLVALILGLAYYLGILREPEPEIPDEIIEHLTTLNDNTFYQEIAANNHTVVLFCIV